MYLLGKLSDLLMVYGDLVLSCYEFLNLAKTILWLVNTNAIEAHIYSEESNKMQNILNSSLYNFFNILIILFYFCWLNFTRLLCSISWLNESMQNPF